VGLPDVATAGRRQPYRGQPPDRWCATAGIETGDLIATGTCHEGLGPIQDGDVVTTEIEGIGSLTVTASDPQHRHW